MTHKFPRRITSVFCILSLVLALQGCGMATESTENEQANKVTITMAYTGDDAAKDYLMYLREKFPDIQIEMFSYESSMETVEGTDDLLDYMSSHGRVADITISNGLNQELPGLTDTFADLSGKSYSANYQTSYLNDVTIDGSVYYLPFYLTVKGLICNKSLFEKKGWAFPENYKEFEALLKTISSDPEGIRPIYDEHSTNSVQYWMSVYYGLNEGSVLPGYEALQEFKETKATSQLELDNTLSYMSLLADTGCLLESTLNKDKEGGADTAQYYALGRGETAMAFGSGVTWTVLKNRGFSDEFMVLPMYSPNCPQGYVLEEQTLNIGISKEAMDNPQKEAVIDELMNYVTSEEGQQMLLEYSAGIKSPCYGIMDVKSRTFMNGILPTVENGYIAKAIDFSSVDESFDETMVEYLFHNEDGHITEQDILTALEKAAKSQYAVGLEDEEPVAEVPEEFTLEQSTYLLLQAMAEEAGTDFAVLTRPQKQGYYGTPARSGTFRMNLLAGNLSIKDIRALMLEDVRVKSYRITGQELLELMDYNASSMMIYGVQMEYTYDKDKDTYQTTGAILPDGSKIRPKGSYTIATSAATTELSDKNVFEKEKASLLSEVLTAYCLRQKTLSPPEIPSPQYIK